MPARARTQGLEPFTYRRKHVPVLQLRVSIGISSTITHPSIHLCFSLLLSVAAAVMADPVAAASSPCPTPGLSPAASPGSEPPSAALSPSAGGTQRLLFSHDLVSGRHRGSLRFGLVRMIHGEEDWTEDEDEDLDGGGGGREGGGGGGGRDGGGDGGGGVGGGGGRVPGCSDTENGAPESRTWPLGRGFVRVQWYPEGTKQDVRETKVKKQNIRLFCGIVCIVHASLLHDDHHHHHCHLDCHCFLNEIIK